jgi:septum formation protein
LVVLGSRSPRRRELLAAIVPAERIRVVPPRSAAEPGFDGVHTWPAIEQRLRAIARAKCDDVLGQLAAAGSPVAVARVAAVIGADTVIVAAAADGGLMVLGQPPERSDWPDVVRWWFREFYFGKTHTAATALCVAAPGGRRVDRIVRTEVTFRGDGQRWLDWYVATGEPRGKAGGYAIQEAGSIFVERIEGSPSNVVGLPLEAVLEVFAELDVYVG